MRKTREYIPKPDIKLNYRHLLFLLMLETEDKEMFKKIYKTLIYYPGKSYEATWLTRTMANKVFSKKDI